MNSVNRRQYLFFTLASIVIYVLGFLLLYFLYGFGSSIIVFVPVIVIARVYGCRAGIVAGLVSTPVNICMYELVGENWIERLQVTGPFFLAGLIATTFTGGIVGRLRDVGLVLQKVNLELNEEVAERKRAEHELMLHRDHLDELVKVRTEELQNANRQILDSEREVRESKEFLENVFETTGDGIFVTDAKGLIIRANRTFYAMSGYTERELQGKHVVEITPNPATVGTGHPMIEKLFAEGNIKDYESEQVKKDGTVYPVELNITILRDNLGEVIGSVCSVRNITRRRQMEEKNRQQQEQLIQAAKMASLGTLVAGIAHEINNPINMIKMHNTLNQKVWHDMKPALKQAEAGNPQATYGGLPYSYIEEKFDQLLTDVDFAARRVENIVKGLKSFARKSDTESKELVDVDIAIENALKLSQTTISKAGVELKQVRGDGLPSILANAQNIEQIFLNIIINAIEAVPHGAGIISIASGYDREAHLVRVEIADNGPGIAPELKDKIFDPFLTSKQAEGGTGLGLSIAYNLVQQHDGHISFVSDQDTGTTFIVSFPAVVNT